MKKKLVKTLSLLLTSVMLVTSVNLGAYATEVDEEVVIEESEGILNNPYFTTNEDGETITVWDCVYFGNYYQSEYKPIKEPENPVSGQVYVDSDNTSFIYESVYAVWGEIIMRFIN